MARVGQQIAGLDEDRLPGRVAVGVLTRVFPPGLVDEVVAAAKVGEQRVRILPARLVVYYTLAMIVFFQSSYPQVWVKLIGGLDWAKSFRDRVAVGMSPSPAAISKARGRLGWQVMADLLDRVAGPLAGQGGGWAYVAGLRLVAVDGADRRCVGHRQERGRVRSPWWRVRPGGVSPGAGGRTGRVRVPGVDGREVRGDHHR